MCGRFTLRTPTHLLAQRFLFDASLQLPLRFNIAPTQEIAAVRRPPEQAARELVQLRWGLIPAWAKEPAIGNRMINARAETVAEKPSFRTPFRQRRCLILADGYFEWQKTRQRKQPYYVRMKDDRPFAFAGLWDCWRDEHDRALETCVILTTSANELTKPIHDRMPVILADADHELWLDCQVQEPGRLEPFLRPYDSREMVASPVSAFVNNVRNDEPKCIQPIEGAGRT